jgi:hypothetical protein
MKRIALLIVFGLLLFAVPSASSQTGTLCTAGASSIAVGEPPVTIWYPPGCIHA